MFFSTIFVYKRSISYGLNHITVKQIHLYKKNKKKRIYKVEICLPVSQVVNYIIHSSYFSFYS